MKTPELDTERLKLRVIEKDDVNSIFNCWMNDEDVSRYMWWKASNDIKNAEKFVQFELGNIDNNQWYRWLIELKETGELIGTCLIFFNDEENHWDISYNLGKKYWGKGYVTEAMKRVMHFGVNDLQIKECNTTYAKENPGSGKVLEKLGFIYVEDAPYGCSAGEIQTIGRRMVYKI